VPSRPVPRWCILPTTKFNDFLLDDVRNDAKEAGGILESFLTVIDMVQAPPMGESVVVNNLFVSRLVSTGLLTFPYKSTLPLIVTFSYFQDIDVINANVISEDGQLIPKRNSYVPTEFLNPAFLKAIGLATDAISEISEISPSTPVSATSSQSTAVHIAGLRDEVL